MIHISAIKAAFKCTLFLYPHHASHQGLKRYRQIRRVKHAAVQKFTFYDCQMNQIYIPYNELNPTLISTTLSSLANKTNY